MKVNQNEVHYFWKIIPLSIILIWIGSNLITRFSYVIETSGILILMIGIILAIIYTLIEPKKAELK